jgi:hypothetical protein
MGGWKGEGEKYTVWSGPKRVPVNMNVAGPWVMMLGWPVSLAGSQYRLREGARVGMAVVVSGTSSSVLVAEVDGRRSTRVVVITYVVRLLTLSTATTEPESRWNMVYGRPL